MPGHDMIPTERFFTIESGSILAKETAAIEFKRNFYHPRSADKSYLRTTAAFANTLGGLILFGVENDGSVVGIPDDRFDVFDPRDLSNELGRFFSPDIRFELAGKDFEELRLGLLYVEESSDKPVIAVSNDSRGTIHEGDIFYRYPGQTTRIRYADLRRILELREHRINDRWMQLLRGIATIGPDNVGVLDLTTGRVQTSNATLLVDEKLLDQVRFVKAGEIGEEDLPTLRLTGEVTNIEGARVIRIREDHVVALTELDLFVAFLSESDPLDPLEYLKAAAFGRTKFVPIYRFADIAGLGADSLLSRLRPLGGPKASDLIARVRNEGRDPTRFVYGSIDSESWASERKASYFDALTDDEAINPAELDAQELRYMIQAITHLEQGQYSPAGVHRLLQELVAKWDKQDQKIKTDLRRAICHLDLVEYGKTVFGQG